MTIRLKPNLCLVKLAPVMSQSQLIITAPDAQMFDDGETSVVLTRQSNHPVHGKVVQVGEKVRDVAVGDVVMFSPEAGTPCDDLFPTPHLFILEAQIDGIVEPKELTV